jgi:hypothetical protein
MPTLKMKSTRISRLTSEETMKLKKWSWHPKALAARIRRWRKSLGLVYDRSERRWIKPH